MKSNLTKAFAVLRKKAILLNKTSGVVNLVVGLLFQKKKQIKQFFIIVKITIIKKKVCLLC
jgi:hypothetical protein